MKISFSQFYGVAPKFDDEQLNDGYAVVAENMRSGRGILEPYKAPNPTGVSAIESPASIFKYRTQWFAWSEITHAIRAPLKNDAYGYVVMTSATTEPQMTTNEVAEIASPFPSGTYQLGVPVPDAPIVGEVTDQSDWYWETDGTTTNEDLPEEEPEDDEYDLTATAYAICYVDAFGRLSAVSELSEVIEMKEYGTRNTQQVTIRLPDLPSDLFVTNGVRGTTASVRIYRTNYTGSESILQFVAEVDYTTETYTDTMYSGDLGDTPVNETWNPPPGLDTNLFPNGPMRKVVVMGSDLVVGHNDKLVCFAEPDAFYAYPPEYYQVFQESIVTITPAGSALVVLTNGFPYVVEGSHPASMDPVKLSDPVPCVSELGVTEVAGSVFFVGQEGLWQITGYTLSNISREFMTLREWKELDPSTIKLANYDGSVFIICPSVGYTYVYNPSAPTEAFKKITLDISATAQLDGTNDLMLVENGSTEISEFDGHASEFLPLTWTSKTYTFNEPINFSVMKIKANRYPITVTIECDKLDGSGVYTATRTAYDGRFIYLPFQGRSMAWRCSVTAESNTQVLEVRSIEIGQSPAELA